jgi:hypothetical protein
LETSGLRRKSVHDWTELRAGDEVPITAILDRLLHRSRMLKFERCGYRPRELEDVPRLSRS